MCLILCVPGFNSHGEHLGNAFQHALLMSNKVRTCDGDDAPLNRRMSRFGHYIPCFNVSRYYCDVKFCTSFYHRYYLLLDVRTFVSEKAHLGADRRVNGLARGRSTLLMLLASSSKRTSQILHLGMIQSICPCRYSCRAGTSCTACRTKGGLPCPCSHLSRAYLSSLSSGKYSSHRATRTYVNS